MTPLAARIVLGILAVQSLLPGVWGTVAPRSLYDDFPGLGRTWISVDGPYNEHLVRDFGALNLALAVLTIAAFVTLTRGLVLTAGIAWLVWSVPHFVYHLRHREVFEGVDEPVAIGGIALLALLGLLLVALPVRPSAVSSDSPRAHA